MTGLIYKADCLISGKSYIGQTTLRFSQRKWLHLWSALHNFKIKTPPVFYRAIRKYGEENFVWSILDTCFSEKELNTKEKERIIKHNTHIPFGYNMTDGGENKSGKNNGMFGRKQSEYCKEGNRARRLGKKHTEESKRKISRGLMGRKCSELNKEIIRKIHSGDNNHFIKYYSYIYTPKQIIEKVKCVRVWCLKEGLNYHSARNAFLNWGYHKGYFLVKREKINA